MTFSSVPVSHSEERADIETSSDDYASRFSGDVGAWLLSVQEKAVLSLLKNENISSVLDLGGGHGQLTGALLESGFEVVVAGSDASCSSRLSPYIKNPKFKFIEGDLLSLPVADRSFDAVVSVRFLSHCTQWEKLIEEMCRIAKTAVVLDYPTQGLAVHIEKLLFPLKKMVEGNTRTYRSFSHTEVQGAFTACGFSQVRKFGQFSLPMVCHRIMKSPKISSFVESGLRGVGLTALIGSPVVARFTRNKTP